MKKAVISIVVIVVVVLICACGNNKNDNKIKGKGYLDKEGYLDRGVDLLKESREIANDENPYEKIRKNAREKAGIESTNEEEDLYKELIKNN